MSKKNIFILIGIIILIIIMVIAKKETTNLMDKELPLVNEVVTPMDQVTVDSANQINTDLNQINLDETSLDQDMTAIDTELGNL